MKWVEEQRELRRARYSMATPPYYSGQPVNDRMKELEKSKKKKWWNLSNHMQKNLHNKHNFIKHTIIIYPHYDNSMIKKTFWKPKYSKNTVIVLGTTKQSATLGCTAPIDHSIKVAKFKYIVTVEAPLNEGAITGSKWNVQPLQRQIPQPKADNTELLSESKVLDGPMLMSFIQQWRQRMDRP